MLIGRLPDDRIYKYAGKGNRETYFKLPSCKLDAHTHMENTQGGREIARHGRSRRARLRMIP